MQCRQMGNMWQKAVIVCMDSDFHRKFLRKFMKKIFLGYYVGKNGIGKLEEEGDIL